MWEMSLKRAFLFRAAKIRGNAQWTRGNSKLAKNAKAKEARIKTVCPFWYTTESAHLLNAEGV